MYNTNTFISSIVIFQFNVMKMSNNIDLDHALKYNLFNSDVLFLPC